MNKHNKEIIADILFRCIKSGKINFKQLADKIKSVKNKNAIDIVKQETYLYNGDGKVKTLHKAIQDLIDLWFELCCNIIKKLTPKRKLKFESGGIVQKNKGYDELIFIDNKKLNKVVKKLCKPSKELKKNIKKLNIK